MQRVIIDNRLEKLEPQVKNIRKEIFGKETAPFSNWIQAKDWIEAKEGENNFRPRDPVRSERLRQREKRWISEMDACSVPFIRVTPSLVLAEYYGTSESRALVVRRAAVARSNRKFERLTTFVFDQSRRLKTRQASILAYVLHDERGVFFGPNVSVTINGPDMVSSIKCKIVGTHSSEYDLSDANRFGLSMARSGKSGCWGIIPPLQQSGRDLAYMRKLEELYGEVGDLRKKVFGVPAAPFRNWNYALDWIEATGIEVKRPEDRRIVLQRFGESEKLDASGMRTWFESGTAIDRRKVSRLVRQCEDLFEEEEDFFDHTRVVTCECLSLDYINASKVVRCVVVPRSNRALAEVADFVASRSRRFDLKPEWLAALVLSGEKLKSLNIQISLGGKDALPVTEYEFFGGYPDKKRRREAYNLELQRRGGKKALSDSVKVILEEIFKRGKVPKKGKGKFWRLVAETICEIDLKTTADAVRKRFRRLAYPIKREFMR